jgi:hypothetical protein
VTVLVRIAKTYMHNEGYSPTDALGFKALQDLGYPDEETLDPHGLIDKALEQLSDQPTTSPGSRCAASSTT